MAIDQWPVLTKRIEECFRGQQIGGLEPFLHDVEGLSNLEIAQTLQVKLAAIKSRVHRARLFLRKRPLMHRTRSMSHRNVEAE